MLILKYEKGRVPKKKGRGKHPAKSALADHSTWSGVGRCDKLFLTTVLPVGC